MKAEHPMGTDHDAPAPQLVRVAEAARITGLPKSMLRKTFIREDKRPKNVPPPPPHKRIGRSVYILADRLSEWVRSLESSAQGLRPLPHARKGRPTVAERIARRERDADLHT